jgi:hypothetical protein
VSKPIQRNQIAHEVKDSERATRLRLHMGCHVPWQLECVARVPAMAIVWKFRGTVGPGSLGAGKSVPLDVIDKRLKGFRIFCHGERPKTMLPQSRAYYMHIVIEVTDDDVQPEFERFPRPGFYQVVGLRVPDAGFLFEPPSIPARVPRKV